MSDQPLSDAFLGGCGSRRDAFASVPELERALREVVAASRAAWPAIALDAHRFVAYLAPRIGDPPDAASIQRAHGDLFVACAAIEHDPVAIAAFEDRYLRDLAEYGIHGPAAELDELRQVLRERILVGTHEAPPKLTTYSGAGPLAGWVRIVALRVAANLRRSGRRGARTSSNADAEIFERATPATDGAELRLLKAQHRAELEHAFIAALAALTPRQRNLLRLYYLDGLDLDDLGALHHVHGSTASRWLTAARDALLAATLDPLQQRLGLSREEGSELAALLTSQLDVSIRRLLATSTG